MKWEALSGSRDTKVTQGSGIKVPLLKTDFCFKANEYNFINWVSYC